MKKFLLMMLMAFLASPAILANEVFFYFQDGEEDDFELMEPQTLVSIWNETDEEMVAVPDDMAFMAYTFEEAKILRISPADFDFELVVSVDGDEDTYFLNKEETEWYLTLLPDADNLEIYVRVYLAGQAPGQDQPSNVTMNFNIQAAEDSGIQNPGEFVGISYFDINLFQTVELTIEDNFAGASVAPGAAFEIVPAEGYVITDVMTYLPGVATVSEPGEGENVWRVAVSYEPEGDFASYFITVDKANDGPAVDPAEATITQIEALRWKVEWPGYVFISQTDTDYDDNNAFITDSNGNSTILYADLHGEHENPAITFPSEWGNYFTVNLGALNLTEGIYSLTIPEGYVSLGSERTPSKAQYFDIEVGKTPDVSYNVQFSEVEGNCFDISWENVTLLTPADTEGAYMRNVMTNEEYPMHYLQDDLYSKCNLRIFNNDKLRVNITNNYPDLPDGMYELYIPAGYVKFNGTEKTNEAIEGHLFTYTRGWSEGEIEFNALLDENKLTVKWVDASAIAYNTDYSSDIPEVSGITIFDNAQIMNLEYNIDFTISGNELVIDISELPLNDGECTLLIPEYSIFVTVGDITDYTDGVSFRFNYGNNEQPDVPQLYNGEATWSHKSGDSVTDGSIIEVSWDNNQLSFVDNPEKCSVHNFETGLIELEYGTEVTLSEDKTKLLIDLSGLPENEYRVNVPEACLYINADGTVYLNGGTSMDGITASVEAITAADGRFTVVNINGIVVLDTDNAADLNNLPRGLYIINGRKVMK